MSGNHENAFLLWATSFESRKADQYKTSNHRVLISIISFTGFVHKIILSIQFNFKNNGLNIERFIKL